MGHIKDLKNSTWCFLFSVWRRKVRPRSVYPLSTVNCDQFWMLYQCACIPMWSHHVCCKGAPSHFKWTNVESEIKLNNMYTHTHIHTHTHTHTHAHTHVLMHACGHVHTLPHTHSCTHTHMHIHVLTYALITRAMHKQISLIKCCTPLLYSCSYGKSGNYKPCSCDWKYLILCLKFEEEGRHQLASITDRCIKSIDMWFHTYMYVIMYEKNQILVVHL